MKSARLPIGIILIAVGFIALAACSGKRGAAPRYETAAVEKGRLVARVTATGTLSALVTVQVGSQVSGRIQEIRVDFNSPVTKGQVVARIDPQLFEAAVGQARANLVSAQANLNRAEVQAEDLDRQRRRAESLEASTVFSTAERDTAQANARAAQAQARAAAAAVEQARAALHQAEVNLGYTTIVSPISGIVIARNVDVGQTVAASLSSPTLFTIAEDLRKMQVDTNVAESDIGKIAPGMTASFTVDAYPGESFKGKVRQVRNSPISSQNVVTYDAVIDVDNPELKLRPGMTANVTFVWAEREASLMLPNSALRFRPPETADGAIGAKAAERAGKSMPGGPGFGGRNDWQGGARSRQAGHDWHRRSGEAASGTAERRTVYVLKGASPEAVQVKIGITDGSHTEVIEGEVKEGDAVITGLAESGARPAATPGGMPRGGFGRVF